MKTWIKNNCLYLLILASISILMIFVVFPICSLDYINYDSSYQYHLTLHSMPEILDLLKYDYSPPLYAVLLKLYSILFGHTLYVMRTFSFIPMLGMTALFLFPARRIFGAKTSILCAVLSFSSAYVFYMMPEIRPHILAVFFMTGSAVYAADIHFNEKKSAYVLFTVFNVLSMYTHNVAMLGAVGIYVILLLYAFFQKKYMKIKHIFISGIAASVIYIPWLIVVFKQFSNVKDHYWTSNYGFFEMIEWMYHDCLSDYLYYESTIVLALKLSLAYLIISAVAVNIKKISSLKSLSEIKDAVNSYIKNRFPECGKLSFIFFMGISMLSVVAFFTIYIYPFAAERYIFIFSGVTIITLSLLISLFNSRAVTVTCVLGILLNGYLNYSHIADKTENATSHIMAERLNNENSGKEISFLHLHEVELGIMSYMFPEAKHYVADETYTVLRTYDVFTTDICQIGSIENIWNYTDEVYVVVDPIFSESLLMQNMPNTEFNNPPDTFALYQDIYYYHQPYSFTEQYGYIKLEKEKNNQG